MMLFPHAQKYHIEANLLRRCMPGIRVLRGNGAAGMSKVSLYGETSCQAIEDILSTPEVLQTKARRPVLGRLRSRLPICVAVEISAEGGLKC